MVVAGIPGCENAENIRSYLKEVTSELDGKIPKLWVRGMAEGMILERVLNENSGYLTPSEAIEAMNALEIELWELLTAATMED